MRRRRSKIADNKKKRLSRDSTESMKPWKSNEELQMKKKENERTEDTSTKPSESWSARQPKGWKLTGEAASLSIARTQDKIFKETVDEIFKKKTKRKPQREGTA